MKNRNKNCFRNCGFAPKICLFLISLLGSPALLFGQQTKYLEDKPGKFILENNLTKHSGFDYPALVKSATAAAEWFQQNDQLIQSPRGFDASLNLFANSLPASEDIDTPGWCEMFSINFSFHYFYMDEGVLQTATDWAAHDMEVRINQPFHELALPLGDRGFEQGDDPALKQVLNQANDRLRHFYSLMPLEKALAPGINLYAGGRLLVSSPDRPSPWIQVTVAEVTKAILEYYKIRKASDEFQLKKTVEKMPDDLKKLYIDGSKTSVYDIISRDFESLSPDDMNKPAFIGWNGGVYSVNAKGEGKLVVKYNPDCWNKSWPKTSVQFVSMKYGKASDDILEEFKRNNHQLKDYVGLFINALPVEKMCELIRP